MTGIDTQWEVVVMIPNHEKITKIISALRFTNENGSIIFYKYASEVIGSFPAKYTIITKLSESTDETKNIT